MLDGWEKRLLDAVDRAYKSGKSLRAIGEAAGLGPNFVSQLRSGSRKPRLDSLIRLAEELDVSLRHILFGDAVSREEEEILHLLHSMPEKSRANLLAALQGLLPPGSDASPLTDAPEAERPESRKS